MRPGKSLLLGCLALALLGTVCVLNWAPISFFWAGLTLLLGLAIQDAFIVKRLRTPLVERVVNPIITVGLEHTVELRLRQSQARYAQHIEVHDLHPGHWRVFGLPRTAVLHAAKETQLRYQIWPSERGAFSFTGCAIKLRSGFGFWSSQRIVPVQSSVRVYPNFGPLAKLALVGTEQASRVVGAHLKRRRGEGTEFQQLREYRVGDSMRQIDWKASQRARKLISRDYQDEKNQQIFLLLDTGRRMLAEDGGLTHFDHVLNASLLVSYMALRQGDAVGLMAHGGPARYMAPARGFGCIDQILNTVFNLVPEPVATDYLAAAAKLSTLQRRRSLVLLISNVRDEDIEDLSAAVRQLQKRHLVCVASLREGVIDHVLRTESVNTLTEALNVSSMARYAEGRARAHEMLRAQGVHVLDVNCHDLPSALVEHYLAVKRAGML
jgi:uncharacterized protein (DUF58 family)